MQFQVPQFIETEDRIVGPLTLKQFLYIAAGAALCFALFFFLQTPLWLLFTVIIMPISISFAFVQINGRPLPSVMMSAFGYYWRPRFYIWKREEAATAAPKMNLPEPKVSEGITSRLGALMNQLKTSKNPIPQREKTIEPSLLDRTRSSKERFEMMRKITGEKEMARRVDYR